MSKIKDKITDIKAEAETRKFERKAKHEANKKFRERQKREEDRLLKILEGTSPASKEYAAINEQLIKLSNIHSNDRVSADNICAAVTSIGGLGGAVAYDQRHNIPKAAGAFVRKPAREPRIKSGS